MAGPLLARRSAGILLHPTSLPGPYGVGDLGPDAHRFIALLAAMGQSWWQMLPVGSVGDGNSPYQSSSTFAGSPLLVSPAFLAEEGLVELPGTRLGGSRLPARRADYPAAAAVRSGLLARAVSAFLRASRREDLAELESFRERHGADWLDDYTLYTALKRAHGSRPWWEWERELVRRDAGALADAHRRLAAEVTAVAVTQLLFQRHMDRLRAAARSAGIGLIGDLPIFVADDSADVWARPDLFLLDPDGRPSVVAGVPPDYFSATGQRWGNPLYRWESHAADGYAWWTRRMQRALDLFDVVRIDHFRGFAGAWEIPAAEPTAVKGRWVTGPGSDLFDAVTARLGELPVIAEDLGIITPDVEDLRDRYGFPGMRVAQFGFEPGSPHSPDRYPSHVVAYPGTHDNDTLRGWAEDPTRQEEHERARALVGEGPLHRALLRMTMASAADTVVVPFQDVLELGTEARMNVPGTATGNWEWRFRWEDVGADSVRRMTTVTAETGRAQRSMGTRTAFPYSVHEPS